MLPEKTPQVDFVPAAATVSTATHPPPQLSTPPHRPHSGPDPNSGPGPSLSPPFNDCCLIEPPESPLRVSTALLRPPPTLEGLPIHRPGSYADNLRSNQPAERPTGIIGHGDSPGSRTRTPTRPDSPTTREHRLIPLVLTPEQSSELGDES